MSRLGELGYLGFTTRQLPEWQRYAAEVAGLEVVADNGGKRLFLRMDEWHHRIVITEGEDEDLAYMGWRVDDAAALRALETKLADAGVAVARGDRALADERRVLELITFTDPAGHRIEAFHGPQIDRHRPFHPGRPLFGRFATGDMGLGHLVIAEADVPAAIRFYELLGFEGSVEYRMPLPGNMLLEPVFMHLNARQHSIAFGLPGGDKRINHLMLQYSDLKDLGQTHDLVRERGIPIAMHLGMHANDEMLSFYSATPSGWLIEFGWGGRPASPQTEYATRDIFGHHSGASGFGLDFDGSP